MLKTHSIIERAVDDGILIGIRRAFKRYDEPDEDELQIYIGKAVMEKLGEIINFETEEV